jgi:hypothetical protein
MRLTAKKPLQNDAPMPKVGDIESLAFPTPNGYLYQTWWKVVSIEEHEDEWVLEAEETQRPEAAAPSNAWREKEELERLQSKTT